MAPVAQRLHPPGRSSPFLLTLAMPAVKVYGAGPPPGAGGESHLLAGIIVGVLLAVAWALLVFFTHNPVSLAAWGVGGLIGLTLARAGHGLSTARGTTAVVLTVGSVVLAKALILAFALRPIILDEMIRSPAATTMLFAIDMNVHRSFSPELQAAIDERRRAPPDTSQDIERLAHTFDLSERIFREAHARDSAASPAERERLVRVYSDSLLRGERFLPMLGRLFGLWDLLWLGLGVSTAWKLAERGTP